MKHTSNLHDLDQIKHLCKARYRLYVQRYIAYARLRGFKSFNNWPYHRRGFIECWAAPGFHNFWQVWNPGISYFVFRLYLNLGGNKNWIFATLLAFEINGLIHSIVFYTLSGQWSFVIPILFLLFGILTIVSKKLQTLLNQERWPWIINTVVNVGIVIYSFDLSFKLNKILFGYIQINT